MAKYSHTYGGVGAPVGLTVFKTAGGSLGAVPGGFDSHTPLPGIVFSLHLPVLRPDPIIQLFHHTYERDIFVPERRIISLLLNQQRRDASLRRGSWQCWQSLRASPEFFVTGHHSRRFFRRGRSEE